LIVLAEPLTGCRVGPMLRGLAGPGISSLAAAGACYSVLRSFAPGIATTFGGLLVGLTVFAALMLLIDRTGLREDWEVISRLMRTRGGG
jgi:hypothetical protein